MCDLPDKPLCLKDDGNDMYNKLMPALVWVTNVCDEREMRLARV